MNTRHGASGDIGFTPKASNTNGLRAIKQQYLHHNRISALDFEDVSVMGRPFFLSKSKVERASPLTKCFRIFPHSVRAKEISAESKSIFTHDPSGKVAKAYGCMLEIYLVTSMAPSLWPLTQ